MYLSVTEGYSNNGGIIEVNCTEQRGDSNKDTVLGKLGENRDDYPASKMNGDFVLKLTNDE